MTTWDTATIATLAREAGFVGAEIPTATAIAVASSGGVAHYQHRILPPGCGDWRGLWAINVDRYPELAGRDLYDPRTAAAAAVELTRRFGSFGWSDCYRAGTWADHAEHAGIEASRGPRSQQRGTPVLTGPVGRQIQEAHAQIQRTINQLSQRRPGRRI